MGKKNVDMVVCSNLSGGDMAVMVVGSKINGSDGEFGSGRCNL